MERWSQGPTERGRGGGGSTLARNPPLLPEAADAREILSMMTQLTPLRDK